MSLVVGLVAATATAVAIWPFGRAKDRPPAAENEPALEVLERFDRSDVEAGDRAVIEQLVRHGSDLSVPTHVVHYIYVPAVEPARGVGDQLERDGYDVRVTAPEGRRDPWLVTAETYTAITPEGVERARRQMERVATTHGGEYDGWEAAIQRP